MQNGVEGEGGERRMGRWTGHPRDLCMGWTFDPKIDIKIQLGRDDGEGASNQWVS